MKIVVDPGHGGRDSGAVFGEIREKNIVLDYSRCLRDELIRRGHDVLMTRDSDVFVKIGRRAEFSNEHNADVLISVHVNASQNEDANGAWIIYDDATSEENGEALARAIFEELECVPGVVDSDIEHEIFEDGSGWVGFRQLGVISRARAVAVLVELGFGTNENDLKDLLAPTVMHAIALAIGTAVDRWDSGR